MGINERWNIEMKWEEKFEYAGNLAEELQEVDKMLSDDDTCVVLEDTTTRGCMVIFTIYCC